MTTEEPHDLLAAVWAELVDPVLEAARLSLDAETAAAFITGPEIIVLVEHGSVGSITLATADGAPVAHAPLPPGAGPVLARVIDAALTRGMAELSPRARQTLVAAMGAGTSGFAVAVSVWRQTVTVRMFTTGATDAVTLAVLRPGDAEVAH